MKRTLRRTAIAFIISLAGQPLAAQTLGVSGDHFTVNGTPKFLLFVSYFDAMRRASSTDGDLDTDFQYFHEHGIDGIRIFPNWLAYACPTAGYSTDGLFTNGSSLRTGKLAVLKTVLDKAAEYNLLVDVTFSRETVEALSLADYETQIGLVANGLAGDYPNVLFDLQNEYDNKGIDADVLYTIAHNYVHNYDNNRIVMASTNGGQTFRAGQDAALAGLNVVAIHPSLTDWYLDGTIGEAIASAQSGMGAPYRPTFINEAESFSVFPEDGDCAGGHHDEIATHHQQAAVSAKVHGAAGFTFHTRLTFQLSGTDQTYVSKIKPSGVCSSECTELEGMYSEVAPELWGVNLGFTDDLVPQVTVIKAVHVNDLRTRVNALRTRFGLSPYSWTDASLTVGSMVAKAVHVTDLRTALSGAYTQAGYSAPTYAASISSGLTIAAAHFTELREYVEWLEAR